MKIQQTSLGQYVHCWSFQPCWRIQPSYDLVSNTVTFELILLQTQRRSNWLDEIWCWSPNYKISSYHSSLFTRTEGYRRTWLHYNASHHGGSSCSVTDSDGRFSLPSQSVRILRRSCRITPQSNSPMPVLPTMQSDDVRQENMATVLNINIPLKCFKRKRFIHSTIAELQVSMAVYFLYRNSANDDLWQISVSWIDF